MAGAATEHENRASSGPLSEASPGIKAPIINNLISRFSKDRQRPLLTPPFSGLVTWSGMRRDEFVGHLLLFVKHAGKVLRSMGYSGPLQIEVTLNSILEVPWFYYPGRAAIIKNGSVLDDEVEFSLETTTETLFGNPDGIVADLFRFVMFSVNSPDLVETANSIEAVIQEGYKFNRWPYSR